MEGTEDEKKAKIEDFKEQITEYFKKRRITVKEFFQTCAIEKEGFEDYNDNVARMILDLVLNRV